jgi:myo-inositol-1(or 4)-monophosphatase
MTAAARLGPETRLAVRAARAAGRVLLAHLGRLRHVRVKGPKDWVTEADVAAERRIAAILSAGLPGAGFLGEESGHQRASTGGDCWIVDPLDGTTAFVRGLPTFAVCIALARGGGLHTGVILLPRLGELFVAERGRGAFLNGRRIRVSGTARLGEAVLALWHDDSVWRDRPLRERLAALALASRHVRSEGAGFSLACVAAGRLDGYWEQSAGPWDMAAGVLLVEEAGGRVTDDRGRPLELAQPTILATNGRLHGRILEYLASRRGRPRQGKGGAG